VDDYNLDEIIHHLSLEQQIRTRLQELKSSKRQHLSQTIARYIRRTIAKFQHSAVNQVQEKHVYWLATKPSVRKSAKWREKFSARFYVDAAQEIFDWTQNKCIRIRDHGEEHEIPHDAYLKVAQLDGLSFEMDHFDYIAIDEAQDMTACQANLLWRRNLSPVATETIVYLVGDQWQQLYRFRGASRSFANAAEVASTKKFTLSGSFRFGKQIASIASAILKVVGGNALRGLSAERCLIRGQSDFKSGVVLCRSNNGMFSYLLHNNPARWCFLEESSGRKLPPVSATQLKLEALLWGEEKTMSHKGEVFSSEEDILEYLDDSDDFKFRKEFHLRY
jgi:superfamily I DNA/RNA helicase